MVSRLFLCFLLLSQSFFSVASPPTRVSPALAVIDFYPFGYTARDNSEKGVVFDIVELLEEQSLVTIDEKLMSVPRALRSASLGKNDLLFSYKDEIMVPNVEWLGNLGCLVPLAIPNKNSGVKTHEDLNGKKVGFVGLGYFDVRKRNQWNIEPVVLPNNFIMLKMLVRGRLDVMVVNNAVLNAFLADPTVLDDVPTDWIDQLGPPLPLDQFETHISIAKNSPFIGKIPALKSAIKTARTQGRFKEIFKRYGSKEGWTCYNDEELTNKQWLK